MPHFYPGWTSRDFSKPEAHRVLDTDSSKFLLFFTFLCPYTVTVGSLNGKRIKRSNYSTVRYETIRAKNSWDSKLGKVNADITFALLSFVSMAIRDFLDTVFSISFYTFGNDICLPINDTKPDLSPKKGSIFRKPLY